MLDIAADRKSKRLYLDVSINGTYHLPGISASSMSTSVKCLQDNHQKYHIFFNRDGLHNHTVHVILCALSLGATASYIERAFQIQAMTQIEHLPRKVSSHEEFMRDFGHYLGDETHFLDFQNFFDREIDAAGGDLIGIVKHWLFKSNWRKPLLVRLVGGALHPLIHLGYSLEFACGDVLSEALAQAAVHGPQVGALFPEHDPILDDSPLATLGNRNLLDIVQLASADSRFDNTVKFSDPNKTRAFTSHPDACAALIELANQWNMPIKVTREEVIAKALELHEASIAVYGGAVRPGRKPKLDFFIMHGVTSALFLHVVARQLDPWQARQILIAHWRVLLMYYVSRGRPHLYLDELGTYQPSGDSDFEKCNNPWTAIVERALAFEGGSHIQKTIRSCIYLHVHYSHRWNGDGLGAMAQQYPGRDNWPINAAMMTLDGLSNGESWVHRGVGFNEVWD